jgi:hypothetical protein
MEKRVRRYKNRLKQHHHGTPVKEEVANVTVLRSQPTDSDAEDELDDGMDHESPPQAMIIAETETALRTLSVPAAVAELELSNYPLIMFRNAADGNIGWIDPERTVNSKGAAKANGKADTAPNAASAAVM